jgi:hypothetical protein
MPTDLQTITLKQVEEARAEVERLELAWRQYQFVDIPPEAISQEEQTAGNFARDLSNRERDLKGLIGKRRARRAAANKLRLLLRLWEACHSPSKLALLCGTVVVMILLLSLWAGVMVKPSFGLLAGFVLTCLAILVAVVAYYCGQEWGEVWVAGVSARLAGAERDAEDITVQVDHAQNLVRAARQKWEQARATHERMLELHEIARAYRQARQQYDGLLAVVQSKKYQLLHCDWRSLRGTRFEDFLQQVFETLAYTVHITKTSGDQGLDLILLGRGRKIGVQTKGYSDNVGNHAIMEAHAGMGYYGCDCCVVITNSDFTRQARELAGRLGCRLISGRDIPNLILGDVSV